MTSEVLASVTDGIGTITLNRSNRINALSGGMIARLTEILERWAGDERIVGITIQGAGQRGYCAGADVRILRDWVLAGRADEALGFLFAEYRLDGLVAAIGKPVTAYLRGILGRIAQKIDQLRNFFVIQNRRGAGLYGLKKR